MTQMDCPACEGEGVYEQDAGISYRTGELLTRHVRCEDCGGTGFVEEEEKGR